ncbi:unnamed protein product [Ambrosiozyma monospora]|uniref:Unnamed protein product n=1 Tax=Ambrosiozyma monospora TaxID=43982 RepID=A0ACB5T2F5_AMBMO|nr:unnamed protein product [Ambrosiozyma monospora]
MSLQEFRQICDSLPLELNLNIQKNFLLTLNIHQILALPKLNTSWVLPVKSLLKETTINVVHLMGINGSSFYELACHFENIDGQLYVGSTKFRAFVNFIMRYNISPPILKFSQLDPTGMHFFDNGSRLTFFGMVMKNSDLLTLTLKSKRIGHVRLHLEDITDLVDTGLHYKLTDVSIAASCFNYWEVYHSPILISEFQNIQKIVFELSMLDDLIWLTNALNWQQTLSDNDELDAVQYSKFKFIHLLKNVEQMKFAISEDVESKLPENEHIYANFAKAISDFMPLTNSKIMFGASTSFENIEDWLSLNSVLEGHVASHLIHFKDYTTCLSLKIRPTIIARENRVRQYIEWIQNFKNLRSLSLVVRSSFRTPLDGLIPISKSLKHLQLSRYFPMKASFNSRCFEGLVSLGLESSH